MPQIKVSAAAVENAKNQVREQIRFAQEKVKITMTDKVKTTLKGNSFFNGQLLDKVLGRLGGTQKVIENAQIKIQELKLNPKVQAVIHADLESAQKVLNRAIQASKKIGNEALHSKKAMAVADAAQNFSKLVESSLTKAKSGQLQKDFNRVSDQAKKAILDLEGKLEKFATSTFSSAKERVSKTSMNLKPKASKKVQVIKAAGKTSKSTSSSKAKSGLAAKSTKKTPKSSK